MPIKQRIFFTFLLIAMIPVSAGLFVMFNTVNTTEDRAVEFVKEVAEQKEEILNTYFNTTENFGDFLQHSEALVTYLDSLESEVDLTAEAQVNDLLYSFQETHWGQYHHVFLIGEERTIIMSPAHGEEVMGSPSSHFGENTATNQWSQKAFERNEIVISDYSSWSESDHTHQMFFYPLENSSGELTALLGIELEIPYEIELLTKHVDLGETGEIYIVSQWKEYISTSDPTSHVSVDTPGVNTAIIKGSYFGLSTNNSGNEVVGAYKKHAEYPWILVVEIDADEALKEVPGLQMLFLSAIAGTAFTIMLLGFLLSRSILKSIQSQQD